MKLTFILFSFIINFFFNTNFIKAEEFSALHKLFSDLHFNWFYAPSQAYWDDKEIVDERAVDNKPIFQHGVFVQQQASYAYPYVQPIIKKVRELLGYKKGQRVKKGTKVEMLMGISKDEVFRAKKK